ncbi:MAG: Asp-tRNA(Asn)/Glu-tRNA(Gln) amidotransferase subunit GatA [Clostridiales bacterium]|nr:Asp-tRNA(Asn)/Glu-tRNA(Gln) amidotransferase subunit GatA [Clostridiales bacterium]
MIAELRRKLDAKEISAVELARHYIDRISRLDGKLESYLHVSETVLEDAKEAQKRIDAGESETFTGIPTGLKDNLCTIGMPTTCASKMLEGFASPYDATVVAKLRKQGAVFLGKLNMDEFAMGATTQTSYYKKTKNPFDLGRVPGGSSGGSAAAVSADLCAFALGSDTGGSIRQPASFCGVTGHRPTYGMVSRYGCVAFASSLDQIGPLASSAEDCALVLEAISGPDGFDRTSMRSPGFMASKFASGLKKLESLAGMRIAIINELVGPSVERETKDAVLEAAKWFEKNGAVVERISMPMLAHAVPAYYLISSAEASTNLARFDGVRYGHRTASPGSYEDLIQLSRAEGFGWEVKRRILLGSYALCSGYYDDYYKKAVRLADELKVTYAAVFKNYDAILSPASPMPAFAIDEVPSDPAQLYLADICTASAPLAGLPSVSTPCGMTSGGLPIGLMITCPRWADDVALSLAGAFEKDRKRPIPGALE